MLTGLPANHNKLRCWLLDAGKPGDFGGPGLVHSFKGPTWSDSGSGFGVFRFFFSKEFGMRTAECGLDHFWSPNLSVIIHIHLYLPPGFRLHEVSTFAKATKGRPALAISRGEAAFVRDDHFVHHHHHSTMAKGKV
jgi:hypothetical protein